MCSIGGNVAENAGGAHCLKYGFTVNHVMGAEVVLPDGDVVHLGGPAPEHPGYDLLGAFIGSEGTLGVATELTLRLIRVPEAVQTMLVGFRSVEDAAATVSDIIAAGIVPAAIEMMDTLAIEAAEKAVACGYPEGAVAVLVIELDGPEVEVDAQFALVERIAQDRHAFETRIAQDAAERALMWKGRKSAFAAVGRISPSYFVQDGVIPRTKLPEVLAEMKRMADDVGLRVANVFHAGDGNLHPLVLFDDAVEGQAHDAEELAGSILELCITSGGSITGEHGVGHEKRHKMAKQFTPRTSTRCSCVRCAFDPDGIANPGKVFPTPRLCGERPGPRKGEHAVQAAGLGRGLLVPVRQRGGGAMTTVTTERRPGGPDDAVSGVVPGEVVRPASVAEVADVLRAAAADGRSVVPVGGRTKTSWATPPTSCDLLLDTTGLDRVVEHVAGDLIVVAEAGVRLADLQAQLGGASQLLGLDPPEQGATLGGVVSANASGPRRLKYGTTRDLLIGDDGRARRRDGRERGRQGRQERGRLRPGQALHRRRTARSGVVVSTTWRLHPVAPAARAVVVELADTTSAGPLVLRLTRSTLTPSLVEVVGEAGGPGRLVVGFESIPESVAGPGAHGRRAAGRGQHVGRSAGRPRTPPGRARRRRAAHRAPADRAAAGPGARCRPAARCSASAATGVTYAAVPARDAAAVLPALRAAIAPLRRDGGRAAAPRRPSATPSTTGDRSATRSSSCAGSRTASTPSGACRRGASWEASRRPGRVRVRGKGPTPGRPGELTERRR